MYQMPIVSNHSRARSLDRPPPPTARAHLDESFGRRFVLFADAEEEFDWTQPLRRENVATTAVAALPEANRRFAGRGLVPTYLVDWPVAADPASADAIASMVAAGTCDVGTQLHPWVNPPHAETVTRANSFVGGLPAELEHAKIVALTEKLTEAFGARPISYRAGRYGIGPNTARSLAMEGYKLDVSVRSLFDYSAEGGADFTDHPIWPYWLENGLLEVPLTACLTGALSGKPSLLRQQRLRGPFARTGLLSRVPLTPEGTSLREALRAIEVLLDRGTRLFSLSFHTPSVVPGHTPYVRDEADLRTFWAWWDGVFDLFEKHGVTPARAGDILAAAKG
ncbi:MAG TPA: polysaccharide deacetylase family protein [Allosphingosinicella sp.]|jgi:hypothetical protein